MIDDILTFFVYSWWIIAPIAFVIATIIYFYKKLTGKDDRLEADTNDWLTLLIFLAVVVGLYLFLSDYDNEREEKFEAMDRCMEMTEQDTDDFERCAEEVGLGSQSQFSVGNSQAQSFSRVTLFQLR